MSVPRTLTAFVDGACEPVNPGGTATYGVVIYDEQGSEIIATHGVVIQGPGATNNVAEFAAATRALALIRAMALTRNSRVTIHGASQLVMRLLGPHAQFQDRARGLAPAPFGSRVVSVNTPVSAAGCRVLCSCSSRSSWRERDHRGRRA